MRSSTPVLFVALFVFVLTFPTVPAHAQVAMDTYPQKVQIRFSSADTARQAQVKIAPLYHNLDAAFSSRWDDSHRDDFLVQKVMAKYDQRGTFYLNRPEGTEGLNKTLLDGGNSIGVHTTNHEFLTALAPNRAFAEILGSRIALEVDTQSPVMAFTFPFINYKSDLDPVTSQADLEKMLGRSGLYFAGENRTQFVSTTGLIASDFTAIDGYAWSGVTKEGMLAQKREDVDRPLFLHTMHPWASTWGGNDYPKLVADYEGWGKQPNWWYCNQNQYAAYRYQFLHTPLKTAVKGNVLTLTLTRPHPLDLNDMTPLTLRIDNVPSGDVVSVTSPTAVVTPVTTGDRSLFDLAHNTGMGLPESYVRTDNPENRSELSLAPSSTGKALLYQKGDGFLLALTNTSTKPWNNLRVVLRLPLRYQAPLRILKFPILQPGATQTIRLKTGKPVDDLLYSGDTELDVAQIDFKAEKQVRLYVTCQVKGAVSDASYPRDGFLVLGPLPRDHAGFPFATFTEQRMTEPKPQTQYTLFDDVSVTWQAPTNAQTSALNPNIIWTTGRDAVATFYTWDPKIFYKHGKDLHYLVWGTVVSPTTRTVTARYLPANVEQITVNGEKVQGNKITLKQGANDLRLLCYPTLTEGFSPYCYGAYFQLVDDSGKRLTDIQFVRPKP